MALTFAARAGVAALTALVVACSSSSSPAESDAGSHHGDSGKRPPSEDAGFDAGDEDAGDASVACTPLGSFCQTFNVCCNGGSCVSTGPGVSICTVFDSGLTTNCLPRGASCSSSESCCNGSGNCGEGTTGTCE